MSHDRIGDRGARPSTLPDADGARHAWRATAAPRPPPSSCSPATTAPTRWPGTTGSSTSPATTPTATCASCSSTPTTPSATRATPSRRCSERVAGDGGWPVPYLRDEDQSVARAYGALDDARRLRRRRRRRARLPRRARRRPRRPGPGRRVAARGARRRPRRPPGATAPRRAGRLLDQVEAVAARARLTRGHPRRRRRRAVLRADRRRPRHRLARRGRPSRRELAAVPDARLRARLPQHDLRRARRRRDDDRRPAAVADRRARPRLRGAHRGRVRPAGRSSSACRWGRSSRRSSPARGPTSSAPRS